MGTGDHNVGSNIKLTLRWTSIPSREGKQYLLPLHATKTGVKRLYDGLLGS